MRWARSFAGGMAFGCVDRLQGWLQALAFAAAKA
jgi:hypothetical protein